jgi:hypothetical protein
VIIEWHRLEEAFVQLGVLIFHSIQGIDHEQERFPPRRDGPNSRADCKPSGCGPAPVRVAWTV